MDTLFGNLVDIAIDRLRAFEENAIAKNDAGYYVAYSGGKDSDVILDLTRRAGVRFKAYHHLTTADPPEVVQHVRSQPDVEIVRPALTMWQLIRKNSMPPRRNARYCCRTQKERPGVKDCIVVTGVRWSESRNRSKRRMIETCFSNKSKQYLNVIIDWTTTDVWNYIRARALKYCSLYDEGFLRLGCVLCPMNRQVQLHLDRWPKICRAWERAVKSTYIEGKTGFRSADEYWQWWLDRDRPSRKKYQEEFFFFKET